MQDLNKILGEGFNEIFIQVCEQNRLAAESVIYEDEIPEILNLEEKAHA